MTTSSKANRYPWLLAHVYAFGCLDLFFHFRHCFAFVDPYLHADLAVCRPGFCLCKIHIGAQGLQRDTSITQPHIARHFRTAQTTTYHDLDAFGTLFHRLLDGALHRPTISNASLKLISNISRHQHGICIRRTDFLDIKIHFFADKSFETLTDLLHTFTTDQNTRLGSMNGNSDFSRIALHFNARDSCLAILDGIRQILAKSVNISVFSRTTFGFDSHEQAANAKILMQLLAILRTFGKPAALPALINTKSHTNRMNFTTHYFSLFFSYAPRSRKTTVTCELRRSIGLKRPRAPKRRHLRVGASSAKILATYSSSRLTPKFSSAFATAEASNFRTGSAAALGTNRSISSASFASLPLTRSTTSRTFWADIGRKRKCA